MVQAISLLSSSSLQSFSFFVQLKIEKVVNRKIIFFISIFRFKHKITKTSFENCFVHCINKLDSTLDDYFEEAKELIGNDNITIKYISNEKFFEEIDDPVIELVSNESDTSELYVRAIKLNQLDSRNKHKLISKSNTSNDKRKI